MKSFKHKRRRPSGSSSYSGDAIPTLDESDDEIDKALICPGCETDVDDSDECVRCTTCPSRWHVTCTGDAVLMEIPYDKTQVSRMSVKNAWMFEDTRMCFLAFCYISVSLWACVFSDTSCQTLLIVLIILKYSIIQELGHYGVHFMTK